eukprot:2649-Prorocentrum_lima.AAC.1
MSAAPARMKDDVRTKRRCTSEKNIRIIHEKPTAQRHAKGRIRHLLEIRGRSSHKAVSYTHLRAHETRRHL